MTPRRRFQLLAALAALVVAGACASTPDKERYTYVGAIPGTDQTLAPDYTMYKSGPDNYLGRRCGTLDCHGQVGRGMRLFSLNGLRSFDASNGGYFPNVTGKTALSEDETKSNFVSVVGLEPEVMGAVIASGGTRAKDLLLIKKPLGLETHKGGKVMVDESDKGYLCLTTWIAGGPLNQQACDEASNFPGN